MHSINLPCPILNLRWVDRYVGAPFKEQGREFSGFDCWGMHRHILMSHAGLDDEDVPSYSEVGSYDGKQIKKEIKSNLDCNKWVLIQRGLERPFDAVLMKGEYFINGNWKRGPIHIGTVVKPGWMIHIEAKRNAIYLSMNNPDVSERIVGIYRHWKLQ